MKTAQLGRFDENGNWQTDNQTVRVNGNSANAAQATTARATTAEPTTADREARPTTARPTTLRRRTTARAATTPQSTTADRAAGTSGRRSLPRTAGSLALFELISGLAIAGAYGVRRLRK
jgi:hypothetical protein